MNSAWHIDQVEVLLLFHINFIFLGTNSNGYDNGGYFLEKQNDDMVEELAKKVSSLKKVTIAIGDDVREQNKILNDIVNLFLIF